jgi:hypothetical protein
VTFHRDTTKEGSFLGQPKKKNSLACDRLKRYFSNFSVFFGFPPFSLTKMEVKNFPL